MQNMIVSVSMNILKPWYDKFKKFVLLFQDTNECAENGTICGGLCRNFDGYYECLCDVGYRMANDSYTCDGK